MIIVFLRFVFVIIAGAALCYLLLPAAGAAITLVILYVIIAFAIFTLHWNK